MNRVSVPLALVLVPIVLGCGCVARQSCTPAAQKPAPPPQEQPTAVARPADGGERTAEPVEVADAAGPEAVAPEPR